MLTADGLISQLRLILDLLTRLSKSSGHKRGPGTDSQRNFTNTTKLTHEDNAGRPKKKKKKKKKKKLPE